MMILTRTALAIGIAATLSVSACGGSDEGEGTDVEGAAVSVATEDPAETPPATDPPVVAIPADWPPSIPTPDLEGMLLTGAVVRGEGTDARYDLQYEGGSRDAQVLYDEYEALVLAQGWAVNDDSDPLAGVYVMENRSMTIVATSGAERSRLTVAVAPN